MKMLRCTIDLDPGPEYVGIEYVGPEYVGLYVGPEYVGLQGNCIFGPDLQLRPRHLVADFESLGAEHCILGHT